MLGAGQPAVADLGIITIADAFRPVVSDVTVLDGALVESGASEQPNIRLTMSPQHPGES